MNDTSPISIELFVATGCSHCPLVLNELSEQLKKGINPNDDFDCVEVVEVDDETEAKGNGKILEGDPTDGIPDACYDGNAVFDEDDDSLITPESVKDGFKELVDEDTAPGGKKFYKTDENDPNGMSVYGQEQRQLILEENLEVKFPENAQGNVGKFYSCG